jgi:hypothetical protein
MGAPLGGACGQTSMVALGVSSGYAMKPLSIRLTPRLITWLDSCRAEGEPRAMVVRRLLGEMMEEQRVKGEWRVVLDGVERQ